MAMRTLPGLGLKAGWASGEDGWGTHMNTNLILLSALVQLSAISLVAVLPSGAADGEIYLLDITASANPGMIAIRDDGLWRFIQPVAGWEAHVTSTNGRFRFTGSQWIPIASSAAIPPFSIANSDQVLSVNTDGTGVLWQPQYQPPYELPVFDGTDIGKIMGIVEDTDPESETGAKVEWTDPPLALPNIPANSKGKVAVIDAAGTGITYSEDGSYKAVAPGYVVTDDDMSGRVILGATGNVVIPSGLTRTSTLTISRMSTGEVEIIEGAGVTINVADNRFKLRARYSAVSLVRTGTNTYLMFGDVAT